MKIKYLLLVIIAFVLCSEADAQRQSRKRTVTGTVVDSQNNPVPDALIMADGKGTGRKTRDDGSYKVKIKRTVDKLGVFTLFAGLVEEPVEDRTTINFKLDNLSSNNTNVSDDENNEGIIDAGYGVVRKKNRLSPGSRTDVSGKQYTTFNSIYEMLQTIPGVTVSGNNVTVRGTGTMGNTSPLFVVNGSVVNSISGIDPNMVESIDVLKGPSASVYGVQGANGVILIKLK